MHVGFESVRTRASYQSARVPSESPRVHVAFERAHDQVRIESAIARKWMFVTDQPTRRFVCVLARARACVCVRA